MKTLLEMKSGLHRHQDSELFEKTLDDDEIESLIDKARESALAIKKDKKRDKEEREQAKEVLSFIVSWFTRNTKNWHIVYNWLPYSKPIERDALCPDVHVADFQTFKKRKQSCLTFRIVFQYPKYVRIWEYIQINIMNGRNRPFPVCLTFFPETLFGRNAVINAKLII